MVDKFFIIHFSFTFTAFMSFVILTILRRQNKKVSKDIDEYYENLPKHIEEKEDNELRMFDDGQFSNMIMYVIYSFIPFFNIILVYKNIHDIFYIFKKVEEDYDKEDDKE